MTFVDIKGISHQQRPHWDPMYKDDVVNMHKLHGIKSDHMIHLRQINVRNLISTLRHCKILFVKSNYMAKLQGKMCTQDSGFECNEIVYTI